MDTNVIKNFQMKTFPGKKSESVLDQTKMKEKQRDKERERKCSATLKFNNSYVELGLKGGRCLSEAYASEVGFMVSNLWATANNEFVILRELVLYIRDCNK